MQKEPVKLVDKGFSKGNLILKLNKPPAAEWVKIFHSLSSPGTLPKKFLFEGDAVVIKLNTEQDETLEKIQREAQEKIDYFKKRLVETNKQYEEALIKLQQEAEKKRELECQQEEREKKITETILQNVKI